jgi:hypothetical protein
MTRRFSRWMVVCLLVAGIAGVLAPQLAGAAGQQYYALTVLPMPDGSDGWLLGVGGIDDAGDIVSGAADSGNFQHVLVWPHGTGSVIRPADYGLAQDLTYDGVFLYWNNSDGHLHQYTISNGSDTEAVSVLSSVAAMNAANPRMTVGTYFPQNSQLPSAGEAPLGSSNINQITDLGFGISSGALAINDADDVVGYGPCANSSSCAYVYDHTTHSATVIGPDGSDASATMQATGINASGKVIGQSWSNFGFNRPPFTYTKSGGLVFLGTGTSATGSASAINSGGDVVGEVDGIGATLWPSGSTDPTDLNTRVAPTDLSGWHLDEATGINDEGLIAAEGTLNGQHRAFLLTPVEDGTPPTSTGTIVNGSGTEVTPNAAGWYNASTLKLHVQVADNEGGFGMGTLTVSANGHSTTSNVNRNGQSLDALTFSEGINSVSYYATDLAGNAETAHDLTVKYDKSAPTWSCTGAPSDWHQGNIQLNCTAVDTVSGLANSNGSFTLATSVADGAETATASTNTVTLCDVADNCVDARLTGLKIDNKAPDVTCSQLDSNWHANDVSVDCSASDDGSGLANANDAQFSLTTSVQNGTENDAATTDNRNVCDAVGNCVTVGPFGPAKVDKKGPAISGAPASSPDANNWYNAPVTIHWTCVDAGSGVAHCPADQSIGTEGTNQTVDGTATDNVDNSTAATSSPAVNIDRTAPTLSYNGNQGSYTVDQTVNITCTASDNLSGVASTTCRDITGPAYSFALGTNSFSATATDNAGNVGDGSVSFTVGVTPGSLCSLTEQFVGNSRTATPLCVLLSRIQSAQAMHNSQMKASLINAYIVLVNTHRGLSNQQQAILIRLAKSL